jgi:hypothetical protein
VPTCSWPVKSGSGSTPASPAAAAACVAAAKRSFVSSSSSTGPRFSSPTYRMSAEHTKMLAWTRRQLVSANLSCKHLLKM